MIFTISDIISTLNNVEVKGKENMDRLLGAIMALEIIKKEDEKKNPVEVVYEGDGPCQTNE